MIKWLEQTSDNFKGWIMEHGTNNPFLWFGFIVIGIVIIVLTYQALTKHHQ